MSTRTNQEIFDHVLNFITKQGKPAYLGGRGCQYLASDGSRCAVGCLMRQDPVSDKTAAGLTTTAYSLFNAGSAELSPGVFRQLFDFEIQEEQVGLLDELQRAHDGAVDSDSRFVEDFRADMEKISSKFGLKFPQSNQE